MDHAVNVSSLSSKKKKSEKQKEDEIGEDEVQSIVDERVMRGHHPSRQYRIRWKGYDSTADTWEPFDNLKNCPEKLSKWNLRQKQKSDDGTSTAQVRKSRNR